MTYQGEITVDYKAHRGISRRTYEVFEVQTKFVNGKEVEVAFPFKSGGETAFKVKNLADKKKQHVVGPFANALLFGQDKFDRGSKEGVIITEGEEDAMAAYEMMRGKMACVSIKSGASSAYSCLSKRDVYEYIDSFDKIYICFDNDDKGREGVQSIQGLFDFRKVYHVKIGKHKDANDYLRSGDADDFERTVRSSKRFAPDNIISSFGDISRALDTSTEDQLGSYPFEKLDEMLFGLRAGEVIVVKAPEGVGKQLPVTTRVPTPLGWTTMGELREGDTIFGRDGKETKVEYVTPIQEGVPCYEIEFNDGTKQIAGGPHRWGVYDCTNRYFVKTTEEILSEGVLIDMPNGYKKARYSVPLVSPLEYEEKDLPIDPYLLGYWLGDGHSYSADICVGRQDIKHWSDFIVREEKTAFVVRHPGLTFKMLRMNNLIKNKHIPEEYLRGSVDQRRELLKGLLDSDGNGSKSGVEFYSSKKYLAEQVMELAQSLGYAPRIRSKMAKLNGKEHGETYTIWFLVRDGSDVFKYSRKAEKTRKCKTTRLFKKAIRRITPVDSVPSVCIQVSAEDSLYVIENHIVTHNTEFFRATEHHLLKTTEHPIGIIHLEEDNATTIKALAGYELEVPAVLPDCGLSKQDILDGYKRAVRDDEGRVHIHSSFDVENEEAFLGNIRFLVSAAGCRFIFLDHITWLATGKDDESDERKTLDRISQKLKLLAKELRFCLIMISHVNDEGKTRGSRNITKVANTVIDLSRDLISGSQAMVLTVEKARLGGRTGPAGFGHFDRAKGKLLSNEPEVKVMDI